MEQSLKKETINKAFGSEIQCVSPTSVVRHGSFTKLKKQAVLSTPEAGLNFLCVLP